LDATFAEPPLPVVHLPSVSIYFVFSAGSALVPILALPALTRLMSPQDYGLFALFSVIAMFIGNLFRMELNVALKREFAERPDGIAPYLGTAFTFSTLSLVPWLLLVLAAMPFVDRVYGIPLGWVLLSVVLAYFRGQAINLHHLWQMGNRALPYGVWGLVAAIGNVGLAVALLLLWRADWQARAWAEWIVALIGFVLTVAFLRRDYGLRWQFDRSLLRRMLALSLPLLPSSLMGYVFMVSDRIAIAQFSSAHELGLYSLAVQLAAAVGLVFGAVLPAWESWLFTRLGPINTWACGLLLKRLGLLTLAAAVLVLVLPALLGLALPFLTDRSFAGAEAYLLPCLLSAACAGLFGLTCPILVYMRRTRGIAAINVAMLAFNVLALVVSVPAWGPAGAAYALALTYGLGTLAVLGFMLKYRLP
jgi:O-antigen/teichoic acid export membrane protein